MGTLSSGFALAVQPVSAETLATSAEGLVTADVAVPTLKGELPAYMARPKQGTALPIVLVVQEIFGVHEHIKDVCRRLAQRGYLAIAPELFARIGDVSKLSSIDEIRKVVVQAADAQVLADLDATAAYAKQQGKADPGKLAITGFCWGGRITWLYAAHAAQLKAGVAWYGRVVGEKDQGIPLDGVEQMRTALAAPGASPAARGSEVVVYPDAGHAFFADYRPSYRQPDAEAGWKRMLDWLEACGAAP